MKTENETIKAPTTGTEPTTLDPTIDKGASSIYTLSKSAALEIRLLDYSVILNSFLTCVVVFYRNDVRICGYFDHMLTR